jgi:hypothetical protein
LRGKGQSALELNCLTCLVSLACLASLVSLRMSYPPHHIESTTKCQSALELNCLTCLVSLASLASLVSLASLALNVSYLLCCLAVLLSCLAYLAVLLSRLACLFQPRHATFPLPAIPRDALIRLAHRLYSITFLSLLQRRMPLTVIVHPQKRKVSDKPSPSQLPVTITSSGVTVGASRPVESGVCARARSCTCPIAMFALGLCVFVIVLTLEPDLAPPHIG